MGADFIRIDTRAGTAGFAWETPREIDLAALPEAAEDAAYTLVAVEIELVAALERGSCATCDAPTSWLVVPATGQRLELLGDPPSGPAAPRRVRVERPFDEHPRGTLLPLPADPAPAQPAS